MSSASRRFAPACADSTDVLAFVVTASRVDAEVAADVLWQLGVRAIEERVTAGADRVELWTSVGSEGPAIDRAATALAGRWEHRIVEVDEAHTEEWRSHARPMRVNDRLVVVPAWWTGQLTDTDTDAREVRIEPGGAFGLGDHPTTLLSLRSVMDLIDEWSGERCDVLDVGCGTGVIAIAAALRSPGSIRAIDLASAAVEATIDNARRNGVEHRVVVDSAAAGDLDGEYDLVVANILAPTLVELAPDLRRLTRPAGRLVISGILEERHEHVLAALAPMVVDRTEVFDGWAAVTLRHR